MLSYSIVACLLGIAELGGRGSENNLLRHGWHRIASHRLYRAEQATRH
jgi:hypothetical protein